MKVYHGSYIEVSVIDLSKCELGRDFGKAFYVTRLREQAEAWAKRKGRVHNSDGFVTEYTFYENAYKKCNLNVLHFDNYNEEWLDFIVKNRNPNASSHNYDIVEGPVANDDITQRIFAYLAGEISKNDFLEELKFKHLPSHQIAFCTMASLQMIEWINKKTDLSLLGIDDAIIQFLIKNKKMSEEKAIDLYFTSKTYKLLSDGTTDFHNESLEVIYELIIHEIEQGTEKNF